MCDVINMSERVEELISGHALGDSFNREGLSYKKMCFVFALIVTSSLEVFNYIS